MIISTVHQVIKTIYEDLFRKVMSEVKEEMQKFSTEGTRNDYQKERNLQLKFLNNVSKTVQTSIGLKSRDNECLRLALVDATGKIVNCGRESFAKVELVLLDASDTGNENEITQENFERRIIVTGDKKKPHFAKSISIRLDKGVANLTDLKLGHNKDWTRCCTCSLGARMAENLIGIVVEKAWTPPFKVTDKRGKQYEKHRPPFLTSEVWRLEKIGRKGQLCNRLNFRNINILKDFLFWLNVDPEELQKILNVGESMWRTIRAHAETFVSVDETLFSYKSSTEPQMCVVYDTVGKLKGVINNSHFVPFDNLSVDKKADACKLLRSLLEPSAFVQRYKTFFKGEASLLQQFSNGSNDPMPAENVSSIIPSDHIFDTGPSDNLGSGYASAGLFVDPINSPADPGTLGRDSIIQCDMSDQFITMSSVMNSLVENGGVWPRATNRMEVRADGDARRLSSPDLFDGLDEYLNQHLPSACVEPRVVRRRWKFLRCVLRWCIRRAINVNRKRKR